jgi:hypothetical protein
MKQRTQNTSHAIGTLCVAHIPNLNVFGVVHDRNTSVTLIVLIKLYKFYQNSPMKTRATASSRHPFKKYTVYRGADKSLAQPGRKQATSMSKSA